MLTFDEAWDSLAEGTHPVVLLGNGFSRAWNTDIFDYASLYQAADFGERNTEIQELFDKLETWDFEAIMRALLSTQTVAEIYNFGEEVIEKVKEDQEVLKTALLTAISSSHPELPNDVQDEQYKSVREFLKRFKEIFTVNYDLLMYWARNRDIGPIWISDDGFRTDRWWFGHDTDQNIHFLHGGLHLYEELGGVRKHVYTREVGGGIVAQVRDNLSMTPPVFPLFVAEPTYQKKKQRIDHNPYLSYCFRKLETNSEPMFILGHSMAQNDRHIFEAIRKSGAQQVFVSVFGDEHCDINRELVANAGAFLSTSGRTVKFFNANRVKPWG